MQIAAEKRKRCRILQQNIWENICDECRKRMEEEWELERRGYLSLKKEGKGIPRMTREEFQEHFVDTGLCSEWEYDGGESDDE
jgi:hypothetical protein